MYQLSSSTSRENVYGNTVHIGRRIDREMERNDQSERRYWDRQKPQDRQQVGAGE